MTNLKADNEENQKFIDIAESEIYKLKEDKNALERRLQKYSATLRSLIKEKEAKVQITGK